MNTDQSATKKRPRINQAKIADAEREIGHLKALIAEERNAERLLTNFLKSEVNARLSHTGGSVKVLTISSGGRKLPTELVFKIEYQKTPEASRENISVGVNLSPGGGNFSVPKTLIALMPLDEEGKFNKTLLNVFSEQASKGSGNSFLQTLVDFWSQKGEEVDRDEVVYGELLAFLERKGAQSEESLARMILFDGFQTNPQRHYAVVTDVSNILSGNAVSSEFIREL